MKKINSLVVTATPRLENFSFLNPPLNITVGELIKKVKIKHNLLCERYFEVVNKSRIKRIHLNKISTEYEELFTCVNKLVPIHENTPAISSIREVSEVIEETIFAIWKYMHDNRLSA